MCRGVQQANYGIAGHRFSGAAFTDNAQDLSLFDIKTDAIHRPQNIHAGWYINDQFLYC